MHNHLWSPSCTTHITSFCFLSKLGCLYMTLKQLQFPCMVRCTERTYMAKSSYNSKTVITFWHKVQWLLKIQRKTKIVIWVVQEWHHKLLRNLPFQIEWISFNNLYLSLGMSCEDGSWTIWMHFSSFVTYIFEILDFRCTLSNKIGLCFYKDEF